MNWAKTTLTELIHENYLLAGVLYRLGIDFVEYPQETLWEVCQKEQINFKQLKNSLSPKPQPLFPQIYQTLQANSLEWVLQYLQHSHRIFLKERLPYVGHLLGKIADKSPIIKDLQMIFPLFAEDFILHIQEEENGLFQYLKLLVEAKENKNLWGRLYLEMEKNTLQRFQDEHHIQHDDEMRGIREFTQDYFIAHEDSMTLKVLYAELQHFERELQLHAVVEDNILLPKAIDTEDALKKRIQHHQKLN